MTISKSAKKVTLELLAISLLIMPIVAFGQVTGGPETGSDILGLIRTITNWFAAVFFAIAGQNAG